MWVSPPTSRWLPLLAFGSAALAALDPLPLLFQLMRLPLQGRLFPPALSRPVLLLSSSHSPILSWSLLLHSSLIAFLQLTRASCSPWGRQRSSPLLAWEAPRCARPSPWISRAHILHTSRMWRSEMTGRSSYPPECLIGHCVCMLPLDLSRA